MVFLTSFPPPTEGVRLRQENTQAHIQSQNLGKGTLFIAESRLSWMGSEGRGFSLEYPAITLHAISRDLSAFPHPCLYLMLDADVGSDLPHQNSSESSGDEEDGPKISEIRFVPENPDTLDSMYKVMADCQILHPDQNDSFSEEEEDGEEGYFEGDDGADRLSAEGQATLSRFEAMLDPGDDGIGEEPQIGARPNGDANPDEPMDTAQFDDAE